MTGPTKRVIPRFDNTEGTRSWSPQTRHQIDKLISWGLLWVSLLGLTYTAIILLVPDPVTWRHVLAAGIYGLISLALTVTSIRLIRLVRFGKGRRRA